MHNNNEWVRRTLWGIATTLGAALALGSASLPNLPPQRIRNELPVVHLRSPGRSRLQATPPAPEDDRAPRRLRLSLAENITDPDDTRAAVAGVDALWVATGGGLLRQPYSGEPARWWTTADGLPDHRLTAIAWAGSLLALGTEGGQVLLVEPGPPLEVVAAARVSEARISDLLVEGGDLYASTWGDGIHSASLDRPTSWRALGPARGARSRQVTSLAWLDGELLAGTAGAGLWVRGADGRERRYVEKGGLAGDFVLDVQVRGGWAYAATPGGVSRYRRGGLETRRGGDGLPEGVVRALGVDEREGGGLLLGLSGGRIGWWGEDEATALPPDPEGIGPWNGIATAEVRWIVQAGEWIHAGTDRGILVGGADGWRWLQHDGPGSDDLTTVVARGGRVFAGSFDRGGRLWDGGWTALPLPSGEVNDAIFDGEDRLWVATSSGLHRWSDGGLTTFGPVQGLPGAHVAALARAEGGLFVGTSGGVARFDGVGFTPLGGGLEVRHVYCLASDGDAVFAGTVDGLLSLRRGGSRTYRYETGELPDNWVNAVAEGADGSLWVGTYDHGLALRSPDGAWTALVEGAELPGAWVNPGAMAALPDGSVLVGTMGGGLLRVDDRGRVDRWTAADGLAGDDVTDVAVDGTAVWVATRSGLSRMEVIDDGAT